MFKFDEYVQLRVHYSIERLFWAGNQGNHQNFEINI